jgi:hypothetical protein
MARLSAARRRLGALPRRAKLALVAAIVLAVVAVLLLTLPGGGSGSGDGDDGSAGGGGDGGPAATGDPTGTSTTLNTGGIEVDAPDDWLVIPVPALRFGIAVPPGWEATLLSDEGLATLAGASPSVPDFTENAHAAAAAGGVLYAAGQDDEGRVSDLVVRAAPETGVTDVANLETYAEGLAAEAGRSSPDIAVVDDADRPTVRLDFQVGTGDEVAEGTETLVLGPDDLVWSVTVTSDDASIHDDLTESIVGTLTLDGR